MAHVSAICRYPVKGLSPEFLQKVHLAAGETLPFDRAWAIENGPTAFDPEKPTHLPKVAFLMLMRNEGLAALRTFFDEATCVLTVGNSAGDILAEGALGTAAGRTTLEAFFRTHCEGELRGRPRIVTASGHSFTDKAVKCVSLINLETVRDIGMRLGREIHPLRFRANIVIDGLPAWREFDWIGHRVRVGGAEADAIARTERCAATNVNPQSAARDLTLPKSLLDIYGHADCGIYLTTVTSGDVGLQGVVEPV